MILPIIFGPMGQICHRTMSEDWVEWPKQEVCSTTQVVCAIQVEPMQQIKLGDTILVLTNGAKWHQCIMPEPHSHWLISMAYYTQ